MSIFIVCVGNVCNLYIVGRDDVDDSNRCQFPDAQSNSDGDDTGLSTIEKIGITVGVIVAFFIIVITVVCLVNYVSCPRAVRTHPSTSAHTQSGHVSPHIASTLVMSTGTAAGGDQIIIPAVMITAPTYSQHSKDAKAWVLTKHPSESPPPYEPT